MISHGIPKVIKNRNTKCTSYWLNNETVKGSQIIQSITKFYKLVNTISAELLGPLMISHWIPKFFNNKYTKCTEYFLSNNTMGASYMIQ